VLLEARRRLRPCIACGLFNAWSSRSSASVTFVATLGSYNIAIGRRDHLPPGALCKAVPNLFSQIFYGGNLFGLPAAIVITVTIGVGLQ